MSASKNSQHLVAALGVVLLVSMFVVAATQDGKRPPDTEGEPLWEDTDLSVEERIGNCDSFNCILKAGEKFPSLCHLKAHGRFTRAIVECDATCNVLRDEDPDTFDCWRIESCEDDMDCAKTFGIEPSPGATSRKSSQPKYVWKQYDKARGRSSSIQALRNVLVNWKDITIDRAYTALMKCDNEWCQPDFESTSDIFPTVDSIMRAVRNLDSHQRLFVVVHDSSNTYASYVTRLRGDWRYVQEIRSFDGYE